MYFLPYLFLQSVWLFLYQSYTSQEAIRQHKGTAFFIRGFYWQGYTSWGRTLVIDRSPHESTPTVCNTIHEANYRFSEQLGASDFQKPGLHSQVCRNHYRFRAQSLAFPIPNSSNVARFKIGVMHAFALIASSLGDYGCSKVHLTYTRCHSQPLRWLRS